jgi:N-carbamoylputrescine amidase
VLIVPLFERQAAGVYRNSAAIIDADGRLMGTYRKMHIPDDPLYNEKFYFTPGDAEVSERSEANLRERSGESGVPASERVGGSAGAKPPGSMLDASGFKVWKTRYATIGVLICWDQWYPEAARITSLLGAEVLFYPTAIGWHPSEKDEWGATQVDSWRTIQRSHAIANGVYVAAVNRIGHEDEPGTDGLTFFGHSFVADPAGRVIASAGEEEAILIATCDPAFAEQTRRNWPFLRDRRIDAYGPILRRYLGE